MEETNNNVSNVLNDEEVKIIGEELQEEIKGTDLEKIAELPSNQGVEEVPEENREAGEQKMMQVMVDPNTGEHKLVGPAVDDYDETFEEMCERLEKTNFDFKLDPVSEKDLLDFIANSKENSNIFAQLINEDPEIGLSADAIQQLMQVVNRKINREDFNVYKALPEEIQTMIDKYALQSGIPVIANEGRRFRNELADYLITDFVQGISTEKAVYDFNKEMENMMKESEKEISQITNDYILERNKLLRERIEAIDEEKEPEKRQRGMEMLAQIDEAYNLTKLKEFAKKCKIKKFDLEKPNRIYESLLSKYRESKYNIYDINLAKPILYRHLNQNGGEEEYSANDIHAFLICFCKQCLNMKVDNALENLYMYNVIFNIIWLDIKKKAQNEEEYQDGFLANVKEVIENLRQRNSSL